MKDFLLKARQGVLFRIKLGQAAGSRRSSERSIEIVGPAMKWTDDDRLARAPPTGHHPRPTVPADIMKAFHLPVVAAHSNGAFTDNIEGHVVSRLRDLIHMAQKLPAPPKEMLIFKFHGLVIEMVQLGSPDRSPSLSVG
jgi:hypothetical protein